MKTAVLAVVPLVFCCGNPTAGPLPSASASASASSSLPQIGSGSIGPPTAPPAPRQGMAYIPDGALVAGTPPNRLPRVADAEMQGEQVVLHGFYIDLFPYPNEEGAIPLTNVSREQAEVLCTERGKRLCTELEWERACKGPENRVYEYGDQYRSEHCGTGVDPGLRPTGLRVGCRSDFGVRDLHGGVFEWTASKWNRGSTGELYAVRGGNGTAGEVIGRCANGRAFEAATKSGAIGLRCCAGAPNGAEVTLSVGKVRHLEPVGRVDKKLEARLRPLLPDDVKAALGKNKKPRFDRAWIWRPVVNDAILCRHPVHGHARASRVRLDARPRRARTHHLRRVGQQRPFVSEAGDGIRPAGSVPVRRRRRRQVPPRDRLCVRPGERAPRGAAGTTEEKEEEVSSQNT